MLEVEMKFLIADWTLIIQQLNSWGAHAEEPRKDTDHYFNASDRDFAQTDEAVRVRRIGMQNFLTYKGPKIESATKTRTEIELSLADGSQTSADAVRFLSALGFRPVAVVTKIRQVYRLTRSNFPVEVCLDDVGAVGRFIELEIMAVKDQLDDARAVLIQLASELGLVEQERRSYLRLLLEQSMVRTPTPMPARR